MRNHAEARYCSRVDQRPFSLLNLSQASLSVLKTAPLIIFCSVVAVVGSCFFISESSME